jgi:UrcA family protein
MIISTHARRFALAAAIAALAASTAFPAAADDARRLQVSSQGLNLSDPADVARLDARLTQAARSVCRRPAYASQPVVSGRACVTDTIERAWMQIDERIARQRVDVARDARNRRSAH